MKKIETKELRMDPLFLRNSFNSCGKWGIPLIKNQSIDLCNLKLISCSDTRANDSEKNINCGVHFFVDDRRFDNIYKNPRKSLSKYSQYKFLLTPDCSTFAEMEPWRQLESVAHSRWVGAYWQSEGRIVFPTITWSTPLSYEFCFDGVQKHSIVAIGMIGCKNNKSGFMHGYNAMLNKLEPEAIICFGKPFKEMQGNIIEVDYIQSRKVER